jgi:hypothetical protein
MLIILGELISMLIVGLIMFSFLCRFFNRLMRVSVRDRNITILQIILKFYCGLSYLLTLVTRK